MNPNITLDTGLRRVVLKANPTGVKRRSTKVRQDAINAGAGEYEEKKVEREIASTELHNRATELCNRVAAIKDRHSTHVDELDGHFTDAARAEKLSAEVEAIRTEIAAFNAETFFNPATGLYESNPHRVRLTFHAPEPFGLLMTPEMTATLIGEVDARFAMIERDLSLTPPDGQPADSTGIAGCLARLQNWVREAKNLPGLVPAQAGAVLTDAIEAVREGRNVMAKAVRDGLTFRDQLLALPEAQRAIEAVQTARGWLVAPDASTASATEHAA